VSSPAGETCSQCATALPEGAAFCPACGTPVAGEQQVVSVTRIEPRFFGVPPPEIVLALALLALALAGVLVAERHWVIGPLVLVLGLALVPVFLSLAQRFPDAPLVRRSTAGFGSVRSRAGIVTEIGAARLRSRMRIMSLRGEIERLDAERKLRLRELGEAAYERDRSGVERGRARVAEVDAQLEARKGEVASVGAEAEERVRKARMEGRPTQIVEPGQQGGPASQSG